MRPPLDTLGSEGAPVAHFEDPAAFSTVVFCLDARAREARLLAEVLR